jgi:uncharacterized protein
MLFAIVSRTRYGFGCFLLLLCLTAWAVVGVPELSRRVTDLTATLSADQVAALENKLAVFETQKGSQIAVLIVPTTGSKDIAEFGIEVADLWQVGRKSIDDGVILIVAKDDRKLRLEVGYGLEGVIPDAVAKRVISETITPYFKNGDYAGGIDAGIAQLISLIGGEALPEPTEGPADGQGDETFIFILFGGVIAGFALSAMMGRMMGGMLAGLGGGLLAVLVFGVTFLLALFVGFMIFFIVGVRSNGRRGWSNGGFSGSSGGGSWSGRGGGFGGGGASGSW